MKKLLKHLSDEVEVFARNEYGTSYLGTAVELKLLHRNVLLPYEVTQILLEGKSIIVCLRDSGRFAYERKGEKTIDQLKKDTGSSNWEFDGVKLCQK